MSRISLLCYNIIAAKEKHATPKGRNLIILRNTENLLAVETGRDGVPMKSNATQPKMDIKELDALLKRYLPPETLPQVQAAVSELVHSNLWKLRDELTGMYNTQGILQALKDIKARCLETNEHILILCIDIDKLDKIKQVYGNSEADSVIQTLGHILEDCVPEEEVCGHLGRGEFVIVMPAADTEERQADALLQAVNDRIDSYNNLSDKEYSLHVIHSIFFATPGRTQRRRSFWTRRFPKNVSGKKTVGILTPKITILTLMSTGWSMRSLTKTVSAMPFSPLWTPGQGIFMPMRR